MNFIFTAAVAVLGLIALGMLLAIRIVQQFEMGVHFRLGKLIGVRAPGFRPIPPPPTALTVATNGGTSRRRPA